MFCSFCGKQNEDGASFCERCGKSLNESVTASRPEQAPVFISRAIMEIKQIASSPLFLVAVIVFTVYILFNFLASGFVGAQLMRELYMLDYEAGIDIPYEVYEIVSSFGSGGGFISVILQISNVVIATGLWAIYISAKNKKSPFMKTGGFTAINVIQWINLVFIGGLTLLFTLLFAVIFLDLFSEVSMGIVFLAGLSIMMILILLFTILYYAKIISSVNNIKKTLRTGVVSKGPSMYVGVILVISSVINLHSSIGNTIIPAITYGNLYLGLITGLSSILVAIMNILFAVIIFKTRNILKNL